MSKTLMITNTCGWDTDCNSGNVGSISARVPRENSPAYAASKFGLDGLIDIFTQIAMNSPIVDSHHGHNGEIELTGADSVIVTAAHCIQNFGSGASVPAEQNRILSAQAMFSVSTRAKRS